MKKLMIALAMLLVSGVAMAQDVTTFMGIPIDGTVESVKSKLKAKGFREEEYTRTLKASFLVVRLGSRCLETKVWRIQLV